jgi:DNA-binding transcriptional regulator YiaG
MPNLAQALKAEIVRISRKEVKAATAPLHSSIVNLKKNVVELKRKIAVLEVENKKLSVSNKSSDKLSAPVSAEIAEKVRITSSGIRKIRTKLGLSLESFAKLIGVSSQAVFALEHKEGRLKLRSKTLAGIIAVRGMGKRDVKKKLEEMKN